MYILIIVTQFIIEQRAHTRHFFEVSLALQNVYYFLMLLLL